MIWAFAFLGLFAGSLATTVAHRVPRDQPMGLLPDCSHCDSTLRPFDALPVVGWAASGGMCRVCSGRRPFRYPVVELGTALLFALMAHRVGAAWALPGYLGFATVTVSLMLTDIDWKRIPNKILFRGGAASAALLAIGAAADGTGAHLGRAAVGGLIYFAALFIMAVISKGGMGMGDVKLAALLGLFMAYLSWGVMFAGIIMGFLLGGLVGFALLIAGKKGMKDEVPFGPPLIIGSWAAIIGEPLVQTWMPYLT